MPSWVLFDWGDTLMRTLPYPGPMCTWPAIEAVTGARELLTALHGRIGIALATNAADSQEDEIWKALAMGGMEKAVERIFCFRSVGHKKASPPFFTHVMHQLGASADQLVMVGDDFEQDVLAANAMDIKGVWLDEHDRAPREGVAFHTIHSLAELPAILETWGLLARQS